MSRPAERYRIIVAIFVGTLALGCSDASAPVPPNVRVTTTPEVVGSFASLGGVHMIAAQVTDTLGAAITDAVTWDVRPVSTAITVIDGTVTVQPNALPGEYFVRATVSGVRDSTLVRVLPRPTGKLVFTAAVGTANQVFVKDFATSGDAVQITTGASASGGLAVNPTTGVIIASRGTLPNVDLFRMNTDGSGLVNLTRDSTASNQGPSFNPVTGDIYFSRRGVTSTVSQIFRIALDGSNLTEVTTGSQAKLQPAVSPNGNLLSWSEQYPGFNLEIVTATITGANPVRMTDRTGFDAGPHWVSNSQLAWGGNTTTQPDVFIADAPSGSNARNLTNREGGSTQPSAGCTPGTVTVRRTVGTDVGVYQLDLTTGLAVKYTLTVPGAIGFARRLC